MCDWDELRCVKKPWVGYYRLWQLYILRGLQAVASNSWGIWTRISWQLRLLKWFRGSSSLLCSFFYVLVVLYAQVNQYVAIKYSCFAAPSFSKFCMEGAIVQNMHSLSDGQLRNSASSWRKRRWLEPNVVGFAGVPLDPCWTLLAMLSSGGMWCRKCGEQCARLKHIRLETILVLMPAKVKGSG